MSSKVLITGANGFTGRYLCKYLENLGYEIFGVDTNNCDISNINSIKSALKFNADFIIHLAAIAFAPSNPELIENINFAGSKNLLDAISELKIKPQRVILASSASIYGAQKEQILSEDLNPNPLSPYAKSKWEMEKIAKEYDFNILITRPFNYTGVGQNSNFLIPKIVSHFKQKSKIIELGNLTPQREYNNILDVIKIYEKLLHINCDEQIFNIGSGIGCSIVEILDLMREISGHDIKVVQNPNFMRNDEAQKIICNTSRLKKYGIDLCRSNLKKTLIWMYGGGRE